MKVSPSFEAKNKTYKVRKSTYKPPLPTSPSPSPSLSPSIHHTPSHDQMLNRTSSSSPPNYNHKSKLTKSKRSHYESNETPPITWTDYVWLFIYYICLYVFFAVFWYSLWFIYSMTKSDKPRYTVFAPSKRKYVNLVSDIEEFSYERKALLCNNSTIPRLK